jgi:hypothetical protein
MRLSSLSLLALLALPAALTAQRRHGPATAMAPVITELDGLRAVADSSFKVRSFILTRDAATLSLQDGRIWPLSNVNGRTIGLVFQGRGRLLYAAPTPIERERVRYYLNADTIDAEITNAVLLFADGTLDAFFATGVSPEQVEMPGAMQSRVARARDYLKVYRDRTWDPAFLEPVLNGRDDGMFFALVERERGEELIVQIDPDEPEPVSLAVRSRTPGADNDPETVAQHHWTDRPPPPDDARRRQVGVSKYIIDARMPQAGDGGVTFSATVTAHLEVPPGGGGPWIPFFLYRELEIDSVFLNGARVTAEKADDAYYLWVRTPQRLAEGDSAVLTLYYHGDLMERYGDWFVLKSYSEWYPRPVDMLDRASFDITYHTPIGHPIGSVGIMVDSSVSGRLVTSRWVHEGPMRNAGFALGRFETFDASIEGSPPITLLWSEAGHRDIARRFQVAAAANVRRVMTEEVGAAMKFFTAMYGPPIEPRFFATEIPFLHGVAFPGLVQYSYATFLPDEGMAGFNQFFRAHEVAHQWWGIGVDYGSYRDRWISEGFSSFSGIWYTQARLGRNTEYNGFLREWRGNILAARGKAGATGLGHRAAEGRFPQYYSYAVYEKGAWTLHMLRTLMMQLSTMNEDRFTNGMREFYTTYRGRGASTEDFRVVMEKHAGADLGWFFDQWIYGTAIPTYRWAWRAEAGEGGQHRVRLRVKQTEVPDTFQMYVPVTVELRDGRMLRTRVRVVGPLTEVELPPLPAEVRTVRFNDFEGVLAEVSTESW